MAENNELNIAVAKMEVQVSQLEREMKEIKGDIKFIRQKLDQATGGWKTLMMVGSAGAVIMASVLKVLGMVKF